MAPIIFGIAGAFSAITGVSAGIAIGIVEWAATFLIIGQSYIFNGLMGLLSKKGTPTQTSTTITVRQAVAPRRVIYGTVRAGGIITFIALDSTGQYLYLVITLTGHEVSAIGTMYFDNVAVPLDGSGNATGTYAGYVHAEKNLGTVGQSAFTGLVAAAVGWTTAHRQRGCAGVYVRLKFNADLFNGLPNITFDVDGRKCWDWRSTSMVFTHNTALCLADYLSSTDFGLGVDYDYIDQTLMTAAANTCDESVTTVGRITRVVVTSGYAGTGYAVGDTATLPGYGNGDAVLTIQAISGGGATGPVVSLSVTNPGTGYTTTAACTTGTSGSGSGLKVDITAGGITESRYTCNGIFDLTQTPVDVVKYLAGAMAGAACWLGGGWRIYAGVYRTPSITLTESDLAGPIQYQSRASARDVVNTIRGTYISPSNDWQASDFPAVTNSTYLTEDGGVVAAQQIQLPFTSSSATAQRLGTILLNDMRRQGVLDLPCKLTAYNAWPMDVIQVTNAHFGWTAKTFQVLGVSLAVDDTGTLIYNLHCKETDSAIWSWTSSQELAGTGRGQVSLPVPRIVVVRGDVIEMVRNPNLESGDMGWIEQTGWSIISDTNAYDGSWVAKFVGTTAASLSNTNYVPVQPGDVLIGTCMAKVASGGGSVNVAIFWYNSSKAYLSGSAGNSITGSTYATSRVVGTAPASAAFAVIGATASGAATTTAYADAFNLALAHKNIDEVADGSTRIAPAKTRMDAAADASGNLLLKNINSPTPTTGGPTTTSTTWVDLEEMTVTITTRGNKVLIVGNAVVSHNTAGCYVDIILYVDSAVVTQTMSRYKSVAGGDYGSVAFCYICQPSAASHTFKIQWRVVGAGTATSLTTCRNFQVLEEG
jgi:hypothetical protein